MRLIDADNLVFEGQTYSKMQLKAILDSVEKQPTAYDVEAVIAEFGRMIDDGSGCDGVSCDNCKYKESCLEGEEAYKVALERAMEIVRSGGKE